MSRDDQHSGPSQRQLRVGEQIRQALTEILAREELHDPDLHGVYITISEVSVSPDMRNAKVYVTPLGGGDMASLLKGLGRIAPFLRHEVSKRVHLRYHPRLVFRPDDSFDTASHMEGVFRSLHDDEDLHEAEDYDAEGHGDDGGEKA